MGAIEDALRRREDVEDAEIGAIIELAGQLQEQAGRRLSPADVADIAEQLDIEAEFVEQAIALRRKAVERETGQAAELAQVRKQRIRVATLVSAGAGAVLLLVGGIMIRSGASQLETAAAEVDEQRGKLEQVIDRSFAAAPQQLALVGADAKLLEPARAAYRSAGTVEAKLAAAEQLDDALADALARLPTTDDESTTQVRLNLYYELTGFDNRMATELERYEAARRRQAAVEG
ncbi:MAG TPA: hypothetical protein VK034_26525, partial [Enhygromyxa sp.]|nr:hypothetical protein [Enhygromyxa sp.]